MVLLPEARVLAGMVKGVRRHWPASDCGRGVASGGEGYGAGRRDASAGDGAGDAEGCSSDSPWTRPELTVTVGVSSAGVVTVTVAVLVAGA